MLPEIFFKRVEISQPVGQRRRFDNPHVRSILSTGAPDYNPVTVFIDLEVSLDFENSIVFEQIDGFDIRKYMKAFVVIADTKQKLDYIRSNINSINSTKIVELQSYFDIHSKLILEENEIDSFFQIIESYDTLSSEYAILTFVDLDYRAIAEDFELDEVFDDLTSLVEQRKKVLQVVSNGEIQNIGVVIDTRPIQKLDVERTLKTLPAIKSFNFGDKIDRVEPDGLKESYFSNNFITSDRNNRARFAFGLAVKNLLREKGKFGWTVTDDVLEDIVENSPIVDFNVYRVKVKKVTGYNSLGSKVPQSYEIPLVEERALVFSGGESAYRSFKNYENFKEIETGSTPVRLFTIKDGSLKDVTVGAYIYRVDIAIQDGTVDLMNKRYENLLLVRRFLDELYSESVKINDKFFTQRFIEYFNSVFNEQSITKEKVAFYICDSMTSYYDVDLDIYDAVLASISPANASSETIKSIMELCDQILLEYESDFGGNIHYDVKRSNIIEWTEDLVGVFDTDRERSTSIDYMEDLEGTTFVDDIGLHEINEVRYELRVNNELSKYFNNPDISGVLDTINGKTEYGEMRESSFGYFSPTVLTVNTESYSTAINSKTILNVDKNLTQNFTIHPAVQILADQPQETRTERRGVTAPVESETEEETQPVVNTYVEKYMASKTSSERPRGLERFNPSPATTFSSDLIRRRPSIVSEPPQIQSTFLQETNPEDVALLPFDEVQVFDEVRYKFDYELVNRIEYLDKFDVDKDNNTLIKRDAWKTMTKSAFDELTGEVLCRVVDYENKLKIVRNNVEYNTNNRYFILKKNKQNKVNNSARQKALIQK